MSDRETFTSKGEVHYVWPLRWPDREHRNGVRCGQCEHAHHEQFEGYAGYWRCLYKGGEGRTICETPVDEYGDNAAHDQLLEQTRTPTWCPAIYRGKT